MMAEGEAFDRLRRWAARNGMDAESITSADWEAGSINGTWVFFPPGRTSLVFLVKPNEVQVVNRTQESLREILSELEAK